MCLSRHLTAGLLYNDWSSYKEQNPKYGCTIVEIEIVWSECVRQIWFGHNWNFGFECNSRPCSACHHFTYHCIVSVHHINCLHFLSYHISFLIMSCIFPNIWSCFCKGRQVEQVRFPEVKKGLIAGQKYEDIKAK